MKFHIHKYLCTLFLTMVFICSIEPVLGQNKNRRQSRSTVTIEVVDEAGTPIGYSEISSSRNRHTYIADDQGVSTISILPIDVLKVKADGYGSKTISASDIRKNIQEGKEWKQYVPEFVYKYLTENQLDKRIKKFLDEENKSF